ncbi:MAG: methonine synthase, partial [Candidatus Altarchaeaceae archaeon]
KNLDFSRKDVENAGKFLRIGISRSNIFGIIADNEKLAREKKFKEMVEISETVEVIKERLRYAYEKFGDLIKYVGPDCGLGTWSDFETAKILLRNTRIAVRKFENELKK